MNLNKYYILYYNFWLIFKRFRLSQEKEVNLFNFLARNLIKFFLQVRFGVSLCIAILLFTGRSATNPEIETFIIQEDEIVLFFILLSHSIIIFLISANFSWRITFLHVKFEIHVRISFCRYIIIFNLCENLHLTFILIIF